ncbi:MAG: zinc ribbon domain-containing protein [Zoogloeaceae bacterium]|nr:zinc ribbon domain-containing protein [Zoogloeaceae bacterium]
MSDAALLCPHCQSPLIAGAKFCKACGSAVAVSATPAAAASTCPACHADLPVGARFCKSCGADLRAPSISPAPVQAASPPPVAPAPAPAPVPPAPPVQPVVQPTVQPAVQPTPQPAAQAVASSAAPKAGGSNNPLRIVLAVLALIVVTGMGLGIYFVVNMNKIETPVAPAKAPAPVTAPLPGSEATPEHTETVAPSELEATAGETPVQPAATSTQQPPASVTKPTGPKPEARPPVESRPKAESSSEPKPETRPEPQRPRNCKSAVRGGILLCNIEGASRFWRCAPDGENWNNDLPGCQRDTGRNTNRPY